MSLRPNARTEVRRSRYKVAVDAEEGRRRREDNMVEIRKNKREESLLKKRREGLQPQQFPTAINVSQIEKKVSLKLSLYPSLCYNCYNFHTSIVRFAVFVPLFGFLLYLLLMSKGLYKSDIVRNINQLMHICRC